MKNNRIEQTLQAVENSSIAAYSERSGSHKRSMGKHRNENRPGYKKTRVGWIPEEWDASQIGSVLDLSQYGCSAPAIEKGNTLVIGMKNIQNGKVQLSDLVRVFLAEKMRPTFLLKREDILINRTNSYELVGKVGIFDSDDEIGFVSYLVLIRGKRNIVKQKYMNYWLNSFPAQKAIKRIATKGVSQANLNPTEFKKHCYIPLPPLPEQIAIASVLECWDRAIHKYEEKIEKKKNIKKGLMQRLLSGKQRLHGFSGEWKKAEIGSIAMILSGGTPAKSNPSFWEGSIPWISSSDLKENKIDHFKIHRFISEEAVKLSATKLIPANSILVVSRVGVGKVALSRCDICTSQDFQNLVLIRKSTNAKYLTYQLKRYVRKLIRLNQGTSICGFLKKDLKRLQIPLPSPPEQKAIASVLSSADSEIKTFEKKLAVVKEQKKFLLNNLVTGSIRLPEFCESEVSR